MHAGTLTVNDTEQLVARAQSGDAGAFERLYRQHVGRVYALCLRLAGDAVAAEELTQDAFVQAWRKLDTFRGRSAFGTWLHRLALNVALQSMRTERRREQRVQTMGEPERLEEPASATTPGDRLDLDRAIAGLPPGARTVFVLHAIEGYTYDEVSELTGSAVGTVKAQMHRARVLLRGALER